MLLPAVSLSGNAPAAAITDPSYLNYIQNKGQWDQKVLFRSDFSGGNVFVERSAFTFLFYPAEGIHQHGWEKKDKKKVLNFHALRLEFDGAIDNHQVATEEVRSFYHNYFLGRDPKKWASRVPVYKAVVHKNMYPGIDVKVFGRGSNVRYDFILSPGADPSAIRLKFTGQDRLALRGGDLIIATSVGEIIQDKPFAYQVEKNGATRQVDCRYALTGSQVSIVVTGRYDKTIPLIIDPYVRFSTYTGSTSDNWGMSASFDQVGNGYTAGICFGGGYPTTVGAFQTSYNGPVGNLWCDISLSKFDSTGSSLLFSTYLGGDSIESPQSITVDNNNCLIVLGRTYSPNFPMVAGCYDISKNGKSDIVLTKFNPTGTALIGSTFIGGTGSDGINYNDIESSLGSLKHNYTDDARGSVHVDENNNIYVTSCTQSTDFPVTAGCYQAFNAGMQDGCVFKMNPGLNTLIFSTYIGGSDNDAAYNLAIDSQDRLYVTGGTQSTNFPTTPGVLHTTYAGNIDGFITHFSFSGNSILQSSYIGTASYDQSYFVQTDKNDNVYLFGQCSGNYPITPGVYANSNSGQFLHKLNPTLSTTIFSSEFGAGRGTSDIVPSAFLVDNCQNIYVSGWGGALFGYNVASSSTFGMPLSPNALQSSTDGSDFYFATFKKDLASLQYGTFFGGSSALEHVDGGTSCFDKKGVIYQAICAGCSMQQSMYVTQNAWSTTNNSNNCNNALVKYRMDLLNTVAQANLNLFIKGGCAPFNANFINFSSNAVSYFWDFGDGFTSASATPSHTYVNVGNYSVTLIATDLSTCNQHDTAHLVINVFPPASLVPPMFPVAICKGDSIQLNGSFPSASSYSWLPNSALSNPSVGNPIAWPSGTAIYSLTLKDSLCNTVSTRTVQVTVNQNNTNILSSVPNTCNADTVTLTTDTPYSSYSWSNGQNSSFITVFQQGLYSVSTIDNNGCKGFDSIHIYRAVSFSPFFARICKGDNVQLASPGGNYSYSWTPTAGLSGSTIFNPVASPAASTIYTLTIGNGPCSSSNTFSVFIKPKPNAAISTNRQDFCTTDSVVLKTNPSYGAYLWDTGSTSSFIKILSSGLYSVIVTDTNGCVSRDSLRVTIYPPLIVPSASVSMCSGQSAQLIAPVGGYTYRWYPVSYLSATTVFNPMASPQANTIYTLVMSNGPCTSSGTYTVIVNPVPALNIAIKTVTLIPGESIQLLARADTACNWFPPYMLSCTSCSATIASPEETITYYCFVENNYGCSNTASVTVEVLPTFYIPNTFSPNGDGLNDVFRPSFSGYAELSVTIFNRWGSQIYFYNMLDGGWDGTYKGKPAELGEYVYKITAVDIRHRKLEKTGPVLLLK